MPTEKPIIDFKGEPVPTEPPGPNLKRVPWANFKSDTSNFKGDLSKIKDAAILSTNAKRKRKRKRKKREKHRKSTRTRHKLPSSGEGCIVRQLVILLYNRINHGKIIYI